MKISLNDLLIKALAIAQKNNPKTLVSWIDDKIIHYENVDVSFAVALDEGLITPIIRNADTKGILEISIEVKKLIKRVDKPNRSSIILVWQLNKNIWELLK